MDACCGIGGKCARQCWCANVLVLGDAVSPVFLFEGEQMGGSDGEICAYYQDCLSRNCHRRLSKSGKRPLLWCEVQTKKNTHTRTRAVYGSGYKKNKTHAHTLTAYRQFVFEGPAWAMLSLAATVMICCFSFLFWVSRLFRFSFYLFCYCLSDIMVDWSALRLMKRKECKKQINNTLNPYLHYAHTHNQELGAVNKQMMLCYLSRQPQHVTNTSTLATLVHTHAHDLSKFFHRGFYQKQGAAAAYRR